MALFLDLDNTLYDAKFAYAYTIFNLEKEWIKKKYTGGFLGLYEQARRETKENLLNHSSNRLRILYFKRMFEEIGIPLPIKESLEFEKLYYKYFMQGIKEFYKANLENYKIVFSILEKLSKKTKIIILTNENLRTQFIKLSAFFPSNLNITLITSEEVGFEKPDKRFFKYAILKSKSKASESTMIGDNLVDDIQGALGSKISAIHILSIYGDESHSRKKTRKNGDYLETKSLIAALNLVLKTI